MSTKYEFHCRDCRDEPFALGERSNHAGDAAALVLRMASGLAALGRAIREPGCSSAIERIAGLDAWPMMDLAGWFAKHEGHDVRLVSEYGEEWGSCGALVKCVGGCGTHRHCGLPPGHEGEHKA